MTDRQTENAADIDKDIRRRHNWPENWQLHIVDDIDHTQDKSGLYVYINWDLQTESARLDVMSVPSASALVSFRGDAENVRKHTMKWLSDRDLPISLEHASYIGSELARANVERLDYVQA